jgi:hypothetical protein
VASGATGDVRRGDAGADFQAPRRPGAQSLLLLDDRQLGSDTAGTGLGAAGCWTPKNRPSLTIIELPFDLRACLCDHGELAGRWRPASRPPRRQICRASRRKAQIVRRHLFPGSLEHAFGARRAARPRRVRRIVENTPGRRASDSWTELGDFAEGGALAASSGAASLSPSGRSRRPSVTSRPALLRGAEDITQPGIALGLATPVGGGCCTSSQPMPGLAADPDRFLGEVMKESAQAALSFAKPAGAVRPGGGD